MKKRKILITGASRGIGWETTLNLVQSGHEVLALARSGERLKALSAQAGANCKNLVFDLAQPTGDALKQALEELGGLDIIINNAGLLITKPFEALSDQDWQSMFEVNVFGVARLIRHCLPMLQKSPRAHIVNISSMGGFQASSKFPGLSAYSASKGALSILSECLAEEWKNSNIKVNALAIGAVQTEMLAEAFPDFQAPLSSQEMAAFISHFALTADKFYNGKVLPVSVSTP